MSNDEECLDKLDKIIGRLNAYWQTIDYDDLDSDNTGEFIDIILDLEDLRAEFDIIFYDMKPPEVSALCLFCGSKFLRSQGHNCLEIKTNSS